MKGSIFMSDVSASLSELPRHNEAPGKALHLAALSCPDGVTQTDRVFNTVDRSAASLSAVCQREGNRN